MTKLQKEKQIRALFRLGHELIQDNLVGAIPEVIADFRSLGDGTPTMPVRLLDGNIIWISFKGIDWNHAYIADSTCHKIIYRTKKLIKGSNNMTNDKDTDLKTIKNTVHDDVKKLAKDLTKEEQVKQANSLADKITKSIQKDIETNLK